jgi:hypothetical protein
VAKVSSTRRGAATWLSKGLKIQEAQIILGRDIRDMGSRQTDLKKLAIVRRCDRLATEISAFLSEAPAYLTEAFGDYLHIEPPTHDHDADNIDQTDDLRFARPDETRLPLPSTLGITNCKLLGAEDLLPLELSLRVGQANDALHEIRLALADKAVLFRTEVRHAKSHAKTTRAWAKVNATDAVVHRHAMTYRKCRSAMVYLGADDEVLTRYQDLKEEDLKVSTAVGNPNTRNHRNGSLSWFWTMDIARDTEMNDWMSECRYSL